METDPEIEKILKEMFEKAEEDLLDLEKFQKEIEEGWDELLGEDDG